ncbi:MAG: ParB/RepB/Spo0J family partition protein [Gammaproteobacteria bacterium]|nr:ParB/RepB/Spo0J family partition protein [Gammaproteobacteria bacterium]
MLKLGGEKANKPTRQSQLDNELLSIIESSSVSGDHRRIPVHLISNDPGQPRKKMVNLEQLADSLKRNGQIQPIVLRRNEADPQRFIIVAGERRWRAAQLAEFSEIEALVRDFSNDELHRISRLQMAENKDRESLTPLEDATWHSNYVNKFFGGDQRKAAEDLGVSDTYVSNRLLILKADDEVLQFADEDVTKDIDTIVLLKRLYEKDKKSARAWMADARNNKLKGSLRTSVQSVLKQAKTGKKKTVSAKAGREASIKMVADKPVLSIAYNGKEEHRYVLGISDLARLSKELATAKKSLAK